MKYRGAFAATILLVAITFSASSAQTQLRVLDVETIMQRSVDWVGSWPQLPFWSERGDSLFFYWNPGGIADSDSLYTLAPGETSPSRIDEKVGSAPRFRGWKFGASSYNKDFNKKAFIREGDLFLFEHETSAVQRLTQTTARESNPQFQSDGSVVYRMGSNLYSMDVEKLLFTQLTDIKKGTDPDQDESKDEQEEFLDAQQDELFEVLLERQERRERREEEQDKKEDVLPAPHYIGKNAIQDLRISPDGRFVSIKLSDNQNSDDATSVQNYVTESGFAEDLKARAKVGRPDSKYVLHLLDLERDTSFVLDFKGLDGAFDIAQFKLDRGEKVDSTIDRGFNPFGPFWNKGGDLAFLVVKAADNKDRWIVRLNPEDGSVDLLDRQRDDAWIAGPGISWFGGGDNFGWMPDGNNFWIQSEESGYSHLYSIDIQSGKKKQLTKGEFEVYNPRLSKNGSLWMFESSEDSPHSRHSYTMSARGGDRKKISDEDGRSELVWAPDGKGFAMRYSYSNIPPEIGLKVDASSEDRVVPITKSPLKEWKKYPWRDPDIIMIPASDEVEVPARIYRPIKPNGAAVLFVHGAGYLHNVHKEWSAYHREYMFHNHLADLGYLVLDLDFRGSAGYGRDWRTSIYRHMGGRDLQDYVDASKYLQDKMGIDPERIGIYGGSYGGFITLMALFTEAEHFGAGAALRSVTDWAHYNHSYTSNILNLPAEDSVAFKRSSPIYFAEGLEDPLLIAHGAVDTNVQYQDVVRLAQRLIELGKENWEMAIYPVEGHGFREPSSWTDEYKRILKLFEDELR